MINLNVVIIGLLFSSVLAVHSLVIPKDARKLRTDEQNHSDLGTTGKIPALEDDSESYIPSKILDAVNKFEASVSESTTSEKPTPKPRNTDRRHHHEVRTSTEKVTSLRNQPENITPRKSLETVNTFEDSVSESTISEKPTAKPRSTDRRSRHHHEGRTSTEKVISLRNQPESSTPRKNLGTVNTFEDSVSESTISEKSTAKSRNTDRRSRHHHKVRTSTEKVTSLENEPESSTPSKNLVTVSKLEEIISERTSSEKPTSKPSNPDRRSKNHHEFRTTTEVATEVAKEDKFGDNHSRKPNDLTEDDYVPYYALPKKDENNVLIKNIQTSPSTEGSFSDVTTEIGKKLEIVPTTETSTSTKTNTPKIDKPWYKKIFS